MSYLARYKTRFPEITDYDTDPICDARLESRETSDGLRYAVNAETVSRAYHPITFDEHGSTVTDDFAAAVAAYNELVQVIRSTEEHYK